MSIRSVLSVLLPFVKSTASDVDAEIAAINQKASADIATAKLKAAQRADSAARAAKLSAWATVKADYEQYLMKGTGVSPVLPSNALTGPTGPSGAAS